MTKLTLYHAAPSRSSIVRWMLEELGEPYDLNVLSLMKGEQHQPAYLTVNPMGKVPALRHGEVIVTEAAAICTYLADEFPHARLNVPVGDPRRGPYLKWLFFSPGCIEPAITDRVKVHYHGTLIDGRVFDSSVDRGQPIELSVNGVIPGWTEALQLMPVGSKWKLFIPSSLAYGDQQAGELIAPGSTLIFDVELLDIVK